MVTERDPPFIGASRVASMRRTHSVVCGGLRRICDFTGQRLLDVGCGTGSFTVELGRSYREVHGVDVQHQLLRDFRARIERDGLAGHFAHRMSASSLGFPDAYFDTIVSIETFEHIAEVHTAAEECARVLRLEGELVLTVPNRLFPFENHGMRFRGREIHGRIPLLPWIPFLHTRFSLARVYTVRTLDRLFQPHGFRREAVTWLWPTFEHGGNPAQRFLRPLFPVMRRLETSPLRRFGTSVVVKYRRVPQPVRGSDIGT